MAEKLGRVHLAGTHSGAEVHLLGEDRDVRKAALHLGIPTETVVDGKIVSLLDHCSGPDSQDSEGPEPVPVPRIESETDEALAQPSPVKTETEPSL